jgi:hypothetical protein
MRILRLALVAGSAAALAAGSSSSPSGAAVRCAPPEQQISTDVAREQNADGTSEVTEYLPSGEYRVTVCDKTGDLEVSQTVSPIRDPDGGVALVPTETERPGMVVSALYGDPDEPRWAADFRAGRSVVREATIPPTDPIEVQPRALIPSTPESEPSTDVAPRRALTARSASGHDACTNPQFGVLGGIWKSRAYGYRINRKRFDFNDPTVAQIVRGHTNWDATRNSCGFGDITRLSSHHLGSTSAVAHADFADGVSVTDKGSMAGIEGCEIAIACTFQFPGPGGSVVETDQRFNSRYRYSNAGAAGRYDVQSISTHESGHSIGLDHANSSSELTMYFQVLAGTTYLRTLAKGDVRGLRKRYP